GIGYMLGSAAGGELFAGEVAQAEEEVVDAIEVAGFVTFDEGLELLFGFFDGGEVEELAEVGVAEELAELVLVDGEGLGAALGEWGVAVVDIVGDIAEEERGGERRRRARVDGVDAAAALVDVAQDCHGR